MEPLELLVCWYGCREPVQPEGVAAIARKFHGLIWGVVFYWCCFYQNEEQQLLFVVFVLLYLIWNILL